MFTVVICGRPNVGKSTLFNRLSGRKKAITYHLPGTTVDTLETTCDWRSKEFLLVDTGGISKSPEKLNKEIQFQINLALKKADLILFVVDGKAGIHQDDFVIASKLKKLTKEKKNLNVILVVNKIDSQKQKESVYQFYKLGFKAIVPISAQTGKGCGDLLDEIVAFIQTQIKTSKKQTPIKVGIFGRQNVGKSSLVNALIGKQKMIVSEIPGTTRDAVDTLISYKNHEIILVDTAGIKRKGKIKQEIDKFSIKTSLKTIEKCDIAILLLDAKEGVSRQDFRIASQILKNKKGLLLLVNKWDIIEEKIPSKKEKENYQKYFQNRLISLSWAPLLFISAKTGKNIKNIFDIVLAIYREKNKILTTEECNNFFKNVIQKFPPPKGKKQKKEPKVYKFIQESAPLPKFSLILGPKDVLPSFYFQFLEKELRKQFGFLGTPIEIIARNK